FLPRLLPISRPAGAVLCGGGGQQRGVEAARCSGGRRRLPPACKPGRKISAFYPICLPSGQLACSPAMLLQDRKYGKRAQCAAYCKQSARQDRPSDLLRCVRATWEASENRIKEVKNMCQADRLSCHRYWANFLRLLISCLAYELFLLLKQA